MNHKNFAQTALAAAITGTVGTSITVASSVTFPAVPFIASIDTEAMLVTVVAGTTWTVTRGYEGSTAATHSNGASVYHDWSAGEADTALGGKYYNVMDYGAKGDGATDDTVAIQAAIDAAPAGATVVLPVPTVFYKTTNTLYIGGVAGHHAVNLIGLGGMYAVLINNTDNTKDILQLESVVGLSFANFSLTHPTKGTGDGLRIIGTAAILSWGNRFDNIFVYRASKGIECSPTGHTFDCNFENVRCDTVDVGFNIDGGTKYVFKNCVVGTAGTAYYITAFYSAFISCSAEVSGAPFVFVNSRGITMESCGIENCVIGQYGAAIQSTSSDITVNGQVFMNTTGSTSPSTYFGASTGGKIVVILGISTEAGTNLSLASADGAGSHICFLDHSRFNISGIAQTNSGVVNMVAVAAFA